ncbi:ABC transporter substrate-binding protein [Arabiibacter massiliensis]|uniref:ABC transporter substrate-binding protein n=1 Tax=Arabiibacter massiliensis TaxID=1870985 RepID=UPI0009BB3E12|nr:extracellular solute-binding protein [Arabiibacter massiliensis]
MKLTKKALSVALAAALACVLASCGGAGGTGGAAGGDAPGSGSTEKKQVTINVKCPPMAMAFDEEHADAEVIDMLQAAGEAFCAQYEGADVTINYTKFPYVEEKEYIIDMFGTPEAADVVFAGPFNVPTYIHEGRVAPLDDMIDNELRADIDDAIWEQCSSGGQTYVMPFYQLQNTYLVRADLMREAGLDKYIPADGQIAQWSTDEFNEILQALKASMGGDASFPLAMFAADNQGDTHTMTLLRAYGCDFYDETGHFNLNTPEGIKALQWIADLNEQGIIPRGAENMDFSSNIKLFESGQEAIVPGNKTILNNERNLGLDVFLANFPSMDGDGLATTFLSGFTVFDNDDADKVQVAKDFVRFVYDHDEYLQYGIAGTPVNKSYVEKRKGDVELIEAYSQNSENTVDFLHNTPNWEAVRAAFYPNMQDLLRGTKTPEEVAAAIDETCNAAIDEGFAAVEANKKK